MAPWLKRLASWWAVVSVTVTGSTAIAADPPEKRPGDGFVADARVQQMAEAYALDATDFARANFGLELDGSERSIEEVEALLAKLHESMSREKPSEETVWTVAKMFGSYVGEVYRRHHGATWGVVTLGGERMYGLTTSNGVNFWPWGRVHNRLTNGPEDNVWHYYQLLESKLSRPEKQEQR